MTRFMKSCFFRRIRGSSWSMLSKYPTSLMPIPVRVEGRLHALGPVLVEGLAQVEGVGHRVEHRLGRNVGLDGMQRGGELDVVGPQLAGEGHPLLDRLVGVRVADLAGRQLLQGGSEHADLHELGLKGFTGMRASSGIGCMSGFRSRTLASVRSVVNRV